MLPHNWYSDAVKKEQHSGGTWISNFSDKSMDVANIAHDGKPDLRITSSLTKNGTPQVHAHVGPAEYVN